MTITEVNLAKEISALVAPLAKAVMSKTISTKLAFNVISKSTLPALVLGGLISDALKGAEEGKRELKIMELCLSSAATRIEKNPDTFDFQISSNVNELRAEAMNLKQPAPTTVQLLTTSWNSLIKETFSVEASINSEAGQTEDSMADKVLKERFGPQHGL